MKKRFLSIVLCAVMLITLLSGCMKKPYEEYFALLDKVQEIKNGTYEEIVEVTIPKNLSENVIFKTIGIDTENLEEDIHLTAKLSGGINLDNRKINMSIDFDYMNKKNIHLTDIYMENSVLYLNIASIAKAIDEITETEDMTNNVKEVLGDNDYLKISLLDLDVTQENVNEIWNSANQDIKEIDDFVKVVGDAVKNVIIEQNMITAEKKVYTLNINNENVMSILDSALLSLKTNTEVFTNLINYIAEKLDTDSIEKATSDDMVEFINEMEKSIHEADIPTFNTSMALSYNNKTKSYNANYSLFVENTIEIKTIANISDKILPFTTPKEVTDFNDIKDKIMDSNEVIDDSFIPSSNPNVAYENEKANNDDNNGNSTIGKEDISDITSFYPPELQGLEATDGPISNPIITEPEEDEPNLSTTTEINGEIYTIKKNDYYSIENGDRETYYDFESNWEDTSFGKLCNSIEFSKNKNTFINDLFNLWNESDNKESAKNLIKEYFGEIEIKEEDEELSAVSYTDNLDLSISVDKEFQYIQLSNYNAQDNLKDFYEAVEKAGYNIDKKALEEFLSYLYDYGTEFININKSLYGEYEDSIAVFIEDGDLELSIFARENEESDGHTRISINLSDSKFTL